MLLFNQLKLHSKECGLGNRAFIIVSVLDGHQWKGKSVPFGGGGISPATFPRTIHQIFINICVCSFSLKSSRKSPFLSSFVHLSPPFPPFLPHSSLPAHRQLWKRKGIIKQVSTISLLGVKFWENSSIYFPTNSIQRSVHEYDNLPFALIIQVNKSFSTFLIGHTVFIYPNDDIKCLSNMNIVF